MIIKYNKEQLTRIIRDIFNLTGVSISILDADYNSIITTPLQEYCSLLQTMETEKKLCAQCDMKILNRCCSTKKLEAHICRSGLCDCAMPIIKYDTVIAFILMGQIRSADSPSASAYIPDTDFKTIERLTRLYNRTPFLTESQLSSLYDLLPHILFDNAIEIIYDSFVSEIIDFIDSNLHMNLSISLLCEKFFVSKNRLYDIFRKNLGCTVTEYINEQRIRRAKELIRQSDDSVCTIAEKVGIYNYTYFCKLFKKISGVTPTRYRKISN